MSLFCTLHKVSEISRAKDGLDMKDFHAMTNFCSAYINKDGHSNVKKAEIKVDFSIPCQKLMMAVEQMHFELLIIEDKHKHAK